MDRAAQLRDFLRGELRAASPDFARWWVDHRLFQHTSGAEVIHHELVGDLRLNYQSQLLPQTPGQYVVLYTAPPGSSAAERLALLSTWNPAPSGAR